MKPQPQAAFTSAEFVRSWLTSLNPNCEEHGDHDMKVPRDEAPQRDLTLKAVQTERTYAKYQNDRTGRSKLQDVQHPNQQCDKRDNHFRRHNLQELHPLSHPIENQGRSSPISPDQFDCSEVRHANNARPAQSHTRSPTCSHRRIQDTVPEHEETPVQAVSGKDRTKKYERRVRPKIRPDRYEYKPVERKRRAEPMSHTLKVSKRSRRRKTGAALNEDFKAPNIEQERITFRPGQSTGMFCNGKTSGPILSGGLPDLTFSKMSFLKKPLLDDTRQKRNQESRVRTRESKAGPLDVSEFFAKPLEERPTMRHHNRPDGSHSACGGDSRQAVPRSANPRMNRLLHPNSKTHNHSPASSENTSVRYPTTRPLYEHRTNVLDKQLHAVSAACDAPVLQGFEKATSHASWSITPTRESFIPNPGPKVAASSVDLHMSERPASFHSRVPETIHSTAEALLQDPLSQSTVERFTRNALLSKASDSVLETSSGPNRHYLSLTDLMDLAKLAELDHSRSLDSGPSHCQSALEGREANSKIPRRPYNDVQLDTHPADSVPYHGVELEQGLQYASRRHSRSVQKAGMPEFNQRFRGARPVVFDDVTATLAVPSCGHYAATTRSNLSLARPMLAVTEPLWTGFATPNVDGPSTLRDHPSTRLVGSPEMCNERALSVRQSVFAGDIMQPMDFRHSFGGIDNENEIRFDMQSPDLQDEEEEGLDSFDVQLLGLDSDMTEAQPTHQQSGSLLDISRTPRPENRKLDDNPHSRHQIPAADALGTGPYCTRLGASSGLHRPSLKNWDLHTRFDGFSKPNWLH